MMSLVALLVGTGLVHASPQVSPARGLAASAAYRGSGAFLLHPGASIGLDASVAGSVARWDDDPGRIRTTVLTLGTELGLRNHVFYERQFLWTATVGLRHTTSWGFVTGARAGLGPAFLMPARAPHTIDDGALGRAWLAGAWQVAAPVTGEIGVDFGRLLAARRGDGSFRASEVVVRPSVALAYPYGSIPYVVPWVDVAVRISLSKREAP